jgi:Lrp/AsnC family transcriptional regulator for asnA, asnC and gidA
LRRNGGRLSSRRFARQRLTLDQRRPIVSFTIPQGEARTLPFQKPDAVDQHILSILETNGRATNREIAESVGVSEGTVRNRIERLMRDDILRIVGVTNPARLGLNTAAVISLSAELSRLTEIAERIAEAPGVVYVGYTTGNADIIALAFFPSNDELTDFMTKTLAGIPGILKAETNIILKPVRSLFPGAPVNMSTARTTQLRAMP